MPPNYRRAFWTSRHHVWLGVLTLGLGFATGEPLGLLAGAVAYAIGLIFIPDAAFFRRSIDSRENAVRDSEAAAQLAAFQAQQQKLLAGLSAGRRARYDQLVAVCRDIESVSSEAASGTNDLEVSTRRQKLDELMWTYLRMLSIEQTLEIYLETERKERIPASVLSLEGETQTLAAEVTALKASNSNQATLAGKERLLTSRLERLQALQQRLRRIEQAQANHDLLRSEQERLVEQVKLIRADAIASKNADSLTSRIDLSIEHLASTNQWLTELAEFKDLTAQMPMASTAPLPAPALVRQSQADPPNRQS